MLLRDIKDQKFGRLTAKYVQSRDRNGHVRWHCECECGNSKDVLSTHLVRGKIVSCGCWIKKGKEHKQWTGYEGLSGQFWGTIKWNAVKSRWRVKLPFELTIKEAWELFAKQNGKCALSGLPIKLPLRWNDTGNASLDRIDSSKGYEISNVQWVHKDVNRMKNVYDQDYFFMLCKLITEKNKLL